MICLEIWINSARKYIYICEPILFHQIRSFLASLAWKRPATSLTTSRNWNFPKDWNVYHLVVKHSWLENPLSMWRFPARKITYLTMVYILSSQPCLIATYPQELTQRMCAWIPSGNQTWLAMENMDHWYGWFSDAEKAPFSSGIFQLAMLVFTRG